MPKPIRKKATTKKVSGVVERDLQMLRDSGLTDETIRVNRLHTERDRLVFPYRDINGKVNGFTRTRPHKPRVKDGKPVKYEQPKGVPSRAYFPALSVTQLRNAKKAVFVTEGEKKALALSQLKLAAIGLGGVWCACKKGTTELIDDLAAVEWEGRDVYVVFDYDEKEKTRCQVAAAKRRLARVLRARGGQQVYDVVLPPGPGGAKQGADDFLVSEGEAAFRALVEQAEPVPMGIRPLKVEAGRTDAANATRLIDQAGLDIRYVGQWGKWLCWDRKRWTLDDHLKIEALAKNSANRLWKDLSAEIAEGGLNGPDMKSMYGFARYSNNAGGIRAMVAMAKSEPEVGISQAELDTDPWLLNVENGTLDLRTGKLRNHQRDDLITQLAPVSFDPDANCPVWERLLTVIFDENEDLIRYVQQLLGYGLTGVTSEHLLPFGYGTGANGKTTLIEAYMGMLGSDYAMKAPPDLLLARQGEAHPTERADLFGKRFVAAVETEAGKRLAESLVKELTGGDRIRARRMREDFWEFAPTHKVWLVGNHKPVVYGTDHGLWRRVKLIPFEVTIPDAKQDKALPEKLKAEWSGILNWALTGCLDWQQSGMQEPDVVREATEEYATENDEVGEFIAVFCEVGETRESPATKLYDFFQERYPDSHISQRIFGAQLAQRGYKSFRFTKGENKARKGWRGLEYVGDDDQRKLPGKPATKREATKRLAQALRNKNKKKGK